MIETILKKNRSTRGFDETQKIDAETLKKWISYTRYCGSAANRQPLKYCILNEKNDVEGLLALTKWAAALPKEHLPKPHQHPVAFVVILQDTSISNGQFVMVDVGIAAQTILLSAVEEGYAGCMLGAFDSKKVQSYLNLKDNLVPRLVIALGKGIENIQLVDCTDSNNYYRQDGVHYVPKRTMDELLIEKEK